MISTYSLHVNDKVFIVYDQLHRFPNQFAGSMKKKDVILTVRVDSEVNKLIRTLAEKDGRVVAWMTRKLITEALENRKLLKPIKHNPGKRDAHTDQR